MKNVNNKDIIKIIEYLKQDNFNYECEYIGTITEWTDEHEEGVISYVALARDYDNTDPYAKHNIEVGPFIFCCHETPEGICTWFIEKEEELNLLEDVISNDIGKKLIKELESVIKPFDFEQYALDCFSGDCIGEAVPYGDPFCLTIDGCVFIIEKYDEKTFCENDIYELLHKYLWSDEKISQAIAEGYEISSDVYNRLCGIPLRYVPDYWKE